MEMEIEIALYTTEEKCTSGSITTDAAKTEAIYVEESKGVLVKPNLQAWASPNHNIEININWSVPNRQQTTDFTNTRRLGGSGGLHRK
ncbi:hypothetical protein F0562_011831 [Nyssa sinensis]|uniref:Uncharacterized protein n=1 Tax=Nyssa sinensis TaxID=561372 RepID=A0A5J4ZTI8_9ASTE|nr:hypothetical protein F0562_011831 [Nyssa sinensis]